MQRDLFKKQSDEGNDPKRGSHIALEHIPTVPRHAIMLDWCAGGSGSAAVGARSVLGCCNSLGSRPGFVWGARPLEEETEPTCGQRSRERGCQFRHRVPYSAADGSARRKSASVTMMPVS